MCHSQLPALEAAQKSNEDAEQTWSSSSRSCCRTWAPVPRYASTTVRTHASLSVRLALESDPDPCADPHFAMPDDAADDNFTDWLHPNPTTGALTTYEGTGRAGYRTNLMIVRNAARKANTTFWNYFLCVPNSQPHASMGQTIGLSFSVQTRHSITLGLRVPRPVNVVTHTPTTDRLAVVGTGRCRSMTCRTHPRARCSGR